MSDDLGTQIAKPAVNVKKGLAEGSPQLLGKPVKGG